MADEALRSRTSVAAEQVGDTVKEVVHKTTVMLNELQVSFQKRVAVLGLFSKTCGCARSLSLLSTASFPACLLS